MSDFNDDFDAAEMTELADVERKARREDRRCPNPRCGLLLSDCPCGFCHGLPVGDAATWLDGVERPPAPCPRCGRAVAAAEAQVQEHRLGDDAR